MTIRKDDFIGNLKIPIIQLIEISVLLPRKVFLNVRIENGYAVHELLRNNPSKRGIPEFASIENGRMISVFPRADKRYRLRVVGTRTCNIGNGLHTDWCPVYLNGMEAGIGFGQGSPAGEPPQEKPE